MGATPGIFNAGTPTTAGPALPSLVVKPKTDGKTKDTAGPGANDNAYDSDALASTLTFMNAKGTASRAGDAKRRTAKSALEKALAPRLDALRAKARAEARAKAEADRKAFDAKAFDKAFDEKVEAGIEEYATAIDAVNEPGVETIAAVRKAVGDLTKVIGKQGLKTTDGTALNGYAKEGEIGLDSTLEADAEALRNAAAEELADQLFQTLFGTQSKGDFGSEVSKRLEGTLGKGEAESLRASSEDDTVTVEGVGTAEAQSSRDTVSASALTYTISGETKFLPPSTARPRGEIFTGSVTHTSSFRIKNFSNRTLINVKLRFQTFGNKRYSHPHSKDFAHWPRGLRRFDRDEKGNLVVGEKGKGHAQIADAIAKGAQKVKLGDLTFLLGSAAKPFPVLNFDEELNLSGAKDWAENFAKDASLRYMVKETFAGRSDAQLERFLKFSVKDWQAARQKDGKSFTLAQAREDLNEQLSIIYQDRYGALGSGQLNTLKKDVTNGLRLLARKNIFKALRLDPARFAVPAAPRKPPAPEVTFQDRVRDWDQKRVSQSFGDFVSSAILPKSDAPRQISEALRTQVRSVALQNLEKSGFDPAAFTRGGRMTPLETLAATHAVAAAIQQTRIEPQLAALQFTEEIRERMRKNPVVKEFIARSQTNPFTRKTTGAYTGKTTESGISKFAKNNQDDTRRLGKALARYQHLFGTVRGNAKINTPVSDAALRQAAEAYGTLGVDSFEGPGDMTVEDAKYILGLVNGGVKAKNIDFSKQLGNILKRNPDNESWSFNPGAFTGIQRAAIVVGIIRDTNLSQAEKTKKLDQVGISQSDIKALARKFPTIDRKLDTNLLMGAYRFSGANFFNAGKDGKLIALNKSAVNAARPVEPLLGLDKEMLKSLGLGERFEKAVMEAKKGTRGAMSILVEAVNAAVQKLSKRTETFAKAIYKRYEELSDPSNPNYEAFLRDRSVVDSYISAANGNKEEAFKKLQIDRNSGRLKLETDKLPETWADAATGDSAFIGVIFGFEFPGMKAIGETLNTVGSYLLANGRVINRLTEGTGLWDEISTPRAVVSARVFVSIPQDNIAKNGLNYSVQLRWGRQIGDASGVQFITNPTGTAENARLGLGTTAGLGRAIGFAEDGVEIHFEMNNRKLKEIKLVREVEIGLIPQVVALMFRGQAEGGVGGSVIGNARVAVEWIRDEDGKLDWVPDKVSVQALGAAAGDIPDFAFPGGADERRNRALLEATGENLAGIPAEEFLNVTGAFVIGHAWYANAAFGLSPVGRRSLTAARIARANARQKKPAPARTPTPRPTPSPLPSPIRPEPPLFTKIKKNIPDPNPVPTAPGGFL